MIIAKKKETVKFFSFYF